MIERTAAARGRWLPMVVLILVGCSEDAPGAPWELDAGGRSVATRAPDPLDSGTDTASPADVPPDTPPQLDGTDGASASLCAPRTPRTTDPYPAPDCAGSLPDQHRFGPGAGDTVVVDLTVGPNDCPHVSYFQETEDGGNKIWYGRWNGRRWEVEPMADTQPNDWENAVAVDAQGRPSVVYVKNNYQDPAEPGTVVYATRDASGTWTNRSVDRVDKVLEELQHRITPAGRPVIAGVAKNYAAGDSEKRDPEVVYLQQTADGWMSASLLKGRKLRHLDGSLQFDPEGRPVVGIGGGKWHATVHVGHCLADGTWTVETLSTDRFEAAEASVAVDTQNRIQLAHCGSASNDETLDYAYRVDSQWRRETIAENGEMDICASPGLVVDLDPRRRLHVFHGSGHFIRQDDGWRTRQFARPFDGNASVAFHPEANSAHVLSLEYTEEDDDRRAVYRRVPLDLPDTDE